MGGVCPGPIRAPGGGVSLHLVAHARKRDIIAYGFNADIGAEGAFVKSVQGDGFDMPDPKALQLAFLKFIPVDDEWMKASIREVRREIQGEDTSAETLFLMAKC